MEREKVRYPIVIDHETVLAFRAYCVSRGYKINQAQVSALRLFVKEKRSVDEGQDLSKK